MSAPELRVEELAPSTVEDEAAAPKRAVRRRRKRTRFKVPDRQALAVRPLWEQASEEERQRAHRYAMAILESWTGRASWEETAKRLELPPVRVHQLSQQAVSGMLAGLLKQPRTRRKRTEAPPESPEEDPAALRKRIRALETKLSRTEDLVRVLQEFPWHKGGATATSEGNGDGASKKKTVRRKAKKRGTARSKAEPRGEEATGTGRADAAGPGA